MRKVSTFALLVCSVFLAGHFSTVFVASAGGDDDDDDGDRRRSRRSCPLDGTWVGTNASGGHFFETIAAGSRPGVVHWAVSQVNNDPTLGGQLPTAEDREVRGTAVRVGRNVWKAIGITYNRISGEPGTADTTAFVTVFEGTVVLPDCDTQEVVATVSTYLADEDGNLPADEDGDGIPEGEADIVFEDVPFTFKRLAP